MAGSVDWMFRMVDRVSAPAKAVQQRLETVETIIKRVEAATKRSGGGFGGWARQGEQGAKRIEQAYERVHRRVTATHQGIQTMMQGLQNGLLVGGAVATGAGLLLGKALGGMGQREGNLESLSVLLKTRNQAQVRSAADWVDRFGDITPFEDPQVMNSVRQLLAAQFKFSDVQGIARITGDAASALGRDTNDAAFKWEIINRALGQIQAKGRLQGDEILQLNEAGIGTDKYLKAAFGANYRKLQEAGKISSTAAINAILKGLNDEFGGAMDRMSKTFNGLWSTLKSRPVRLMGMLFDEGGLDSPKRLLKNLVDLTDFSKPPGSLIARRFTRLGKQLMDGLFGPLANATQGNRGVQVMDQLMDKLEEAGSWWQANGAEVGANLRGFGEGLKAAADGAMLLVKPLGWIVDQVSTLMGGSGEGGAGKVLGFLAGGAGLAYVGNLLTFGLLGKAGGWLGKSALGGAKSGASGLMSKLLGGWGVTALTKSAQNGGWLRALGLTGTGGLLARAVPALSGLLGAGLKIVPVLGWIVTGLTVIKAIGDQMYNSWKPFADLIDRIKEPIEFILDPTKAKTALQKAGYWDPVRAITGQPQVYEPGGEGSTQLRWRGPTTAGRQSSVNALSGVAQRLGIDPASLLAVAFKESSLDAGAVNKTSGASGLIQFTRSTAASMGLTLEQVRGMTPEQQAPYIEQYLRMTGVRAGSSLEQVYAAVFAGSASKTGRVLYTQADGDAYTNNAGLDLNKDGQITSLEAAQSAGQAWAGVAGNFTMPPITINLNGPATPQAVQDIALGVGNVLNTYALEQGAGGRR